ncbi:hypothetical protein [Bacillus cereus group sp. N21]|uniref:hypothetical protein n=1 Tax=Bacillus cereus group sp. N21 TaxID=2794591 RepID=UPI0018F54D6E|nr:hypothetical protein [Bacillus cereus group sp. N21]MBJ8026465.1 hypothetical protein [Bacillus cereus group sp. N21]
MPPKPRTCCPAYNQIRAFYVQAAAAGFQQINFDVIIPFSGAAPLTYFVDSIDWFDNKHCVIITNFQSPTLGVSDSAWSCEILNLYFAGNLQRIV